MTITKLPTLLTTDDVAEYLGVPKRTLEQWRVKKYGPPSVRLGKHARYPEDKLLEWINSQMDADHG